MTHLTTQQVRDLARDIIVKRPDGVRYGAIVDEILKLHPETPLGTVTGNTYDLQDRYPAHVRKLGRGLYAPVVAGGAGAPSPTLAKPEASSAEGEAAFYQPFADFLLGELEEVTAARPLGGAALGGKWGTPDVLGVYRSTSADLIKFQSEITAAEIKLDPGQTVIAFGQAVSYRLFSHRAYLVLPETTPKDEQALLDARCALFGIGLVYFIPDRSNCRFRVSLRALAHTPDMYYVNRFAEALKRHNEETFRHLFG